MDFYRIKERLVRDRYTKEERTEVYPDFLVTRTQDLMVRGRSFYAIWDEEVGLWSTDEYDVQRLVDRDLYEYANKLKAQGHTVQVQALGNFSSRSWLNFQSYVSHITDNSVQLDQKLTFANTLVKKEDYVSKRLPYSISEGRIESYSELVGELYEPEERAKFEWMFGAIISGDSKYIQKFGVFYGPPGTGKGTVLNIGQKLFDGYFTTFEAKALGSNSSQFATEAFRGNPLVAIQHDGDLSRIEDNSRLNSIISHEEMTINEKFKPSYTARIDAFLLMGSNKAVKITDAKSGLIRRLIDIHPSGRKVPPKLYQILYSQIEFELGAIAYHCLSVYQQMGRNYYETYRPIEMMLETDVFFNFIEDSYDVFQKQDGCTLSQAYLMYKQYCDEALIEYKLTQNKFREELKNYFRNFEPRATIEGVRVRSYYSGFVTDKFSIPEVEERPSWLTMDHDVNVVLDERYAELPAQYSKADGTPMKYWSDKERMINGELRKPDPSQVCDTVLSDIDTSREHYVKPPICDITIDFDLKDENGEKSAQLNLEAASQWPPTNGEYSKSGDGVHLTYEYEGDPTELSRVYAEGIEIKVFTGDSSLRRRVSKCNDLPVARISSGLPLKEKKMINEEHVHTEKSLRSLIGRNLRKEIHHGTKPSMDFIKKILDDAYVAGIVYDLTDMRQDILTFAQNSTNQAIKCLQIFSQLKLKSEEGAEEKLQEVEAGPDENPYVDDRLAIFDCEVYPNLFLVNWKYEDHNDAFGQPVITRLINPTPHEIEQLVKRKLVGFNNRRYDNHILYARILGYDNEQLYQLSKKLIGGSQNAHFGEAWNLSYTDVFDFASAGNKKGLKKWQVELGIHHQEMHLDWDEPVPEELWDEVSKYCDNDVISTEAVKKHIDADFQARLVLADLSGLTPNDSTNAHSTRIMFGRERKPQSEFIYTDLATGKQEGPGAVDGDIKFSGYKFDMGKSTYRDVEVGEGGFVHGKPGMYTNVAVLDVASMHPSSIEQLNLFGPYTQRFVDIKNARLHIKRAGNFFRKGDAEAGNRELDQVRGMLDGRLTPYLAEGANLSGLADALKTVINSVYGLTAARFENPFRDPRNRDNIVAKRGALFMVDLMHMVEDLGYSAIHIKTDSIKIPDADEDIIQKIIDFGKWYGYDFEHEVTYEKMCLVNDAVYIAKIAEDWLDNPDDNPWTATGKQFAHPYVYKTMFTKDQLLLDDLYEVKSVKEGTMYLDFSTEDDTPMALLEEIDYDRMKFIGKTGAFVPVVTNGADLFVDRNGKLAYPSGAKGHKWVEAEMFDALEMKERIDWTYYNNLADDAFHQIAKYGDVEWFIEDEGSSANKELTNVT